MHILHYVENFLDPIGGAPIFVRGLVNHLEKYGISQSIVTNAKSQKAETTQLGNTTVFSLPAKRLGYYTIMTGLFNILKNQRFDIVNIHGYGAYAGDVMCFIKKLRIWNIHLVLTTHGISGLKLGYLAVDFSTSLRQTYKEMEHPRIRGLVHHFFYDLIVGRLNINTFDKVIILSEEERIYLSKIGLRNEKSIKMPIAINELFFNLTPSIPIPNRDTILYAGRIDPYKGLATLVEAIKELRSTGTDLKCIIIGKDCAYRSQLESHIRQLGVTGLVKIKDFVPQEKLIDLYSSALANVLTSESEGFPLTLVESMALGTPFIATPVGAIPELAELTGAGILVPVNDPKSLAEAIHRLFTDRDLWSRMSTNGKKFAKKFTWDKIANRYYEIYLDIVQN